MGGIRDGDLDRAVSEWDGNAVVGAYLWWWSNGTAGVEPEDRWEGVLQGRTVELRGPADFVAADCDLLARVLRGPERDPSCDIAYCNHGHWPNVDKSAARLAFVSKGRESEGMAHGRFIWDSRVLFDGGDWNMIPAAMLDLLSGGARVTITGATFYAAGRDYADEDRTNDWESIRWHNPVVNWRVVKNLYDAGTVSATGLAGQVLSLDHDDFVRAISDHREVTL
jgi:hypothetical protein